MVFPKICLRNLTDFSGGENSPEEAVLAAVRAGAQTIGFSVRARTSFDLHAEPKTERYLRQIPDLCEKYREKINILTVERRDFYADPVWNAADVVVGEVGYLVADDGAICPLHAPIDRILSDANVHFDGKIYRMAERYFETLAGLTKRTRCRVIAGFDFLCGENSDGRLFDADSPQYRLAALDALEALVAEDVIFEIRRFVDPLTGKFVFTPLPDSLRWVTAHGGKVTFSSALCPDDPAFAEELEACALYAASCGAGAVAVFTDGKWKNRSFGRKLDKAERI